MLGHLSDKGRGELHRAGQLFGIHSNASLSKFTPEQRSLVFSSTWKKRATDSRDAFKRMARPSAASGTSS